MKLKPSGVKLGVNPNKSNNIYKVNKLRALPQPLLHGLQLQRQVAGLALLPLAVPLLRARVLLPQVLRAHALVLACVTIGRDATR